MDFEEKKEMVRKDLEEHGVLIIDKEEKRQFIIYPDRKEEIFPDHPRWNDTAGW